MDLRALLKDRFGFDDFRPGQEEIVRHVVGGADEDGVEREGRDCMVVMPTGAGKSLCFQVPALARGGTCLVVSPLIALMKDQVDGLNAKGVRATYINSSLSSQERRDRIAALKAGHWEMVYVAPERFSPRFLEMVRRCDIRLLAIDEAHCLSQWGHDFRPDYLRLGNVRRALGSPVTMALTATATPVVQDDIANTLGIDDANRFIRGFDRKNLQLEVIEVSNDREKADILPDLVRGKTALVYAATRKTVERAARALREAGVPAGIYHAGLSPDDRTAVQEAFMTGLIPVVAATNAFGMGVDKENVRVIVHWSLPGTVEAYYQEIGRAGRDDKDSRVVLLYKESDRKVQEFFITMSYPPVAFVHTIYERLRQENTNPVFITRETLGMSLPEDAAGGSGGERIASSCLYVLERENWVRRIHPADRPARVLLKSTPPGKAPRGIRGQVYQAIIDDTLADQARLARWGDASDHEGLAVQPDRLAARLELEREQVVAALQGLEDRGYLVYRRAERIGGVSMLRDLSESLTINEDMLRDRRQREFDKLDTMIEYTRAACRRRYLLEYFGQKAPYERCGTCDACRGDTPERETPRSLDTDKELVVRKALACVARMSQGRTEDNRSWSPGLIGKVLTGSQNQTVMAFRFHKLSTYGILGDWTQKDVLELLNELSRAGALRKHHVTREVGGRERTYAELGLTDVGVAVMLQRQAQLEEDFVMVFPRRGRASKSSSKSSKRKRRSRATAAARSNGRPVDTDLLRELKGIRSTLARDGDVPAYVVAPNRALEDMAASRPTTRQALLEIHGLGPSRVRRYGESFLEAIREWSG